ncbi:MAG TPA: hypothetical protein DCQ93_01490 [Bacteroidetes bacterium]|nr:hypothetical protein [Bacteroidota bacterium]
MKKNIFLIVAFFIFHLSHFTSQSQTPTIGLTQYDLPNTDGYILFAPVPSKNTYLINKCGELIHQWNSNYNPGLSAYLLSDGKLLRAGYGLNTHFTAGGCGGVIEEYDWSGTLTWKYFISDSFQCQHHDVKILPNGNVLAIVWDRRDSTEAVANGKNPATTNAELWSEKIVELQPVGTNSANIIWEWKLWDHLVQDFDSGKPNYGVVSDHPELVNLNYFVGPPTSFDWIHFNSIDYNPALDQILLSSHNLSEIWIIDHSTTTTQAATHAGGNSGKGGDILYRWGNPQAYNRGNASDQKFFKQHHARWIGSGLPDEGKILVFNNGLNRTGGDYSSVDMIATPIDGNNQYPVPATIAFLPSNLFWTYSAPTPSDFYAPNISGAYQLANRSFIITDGPKGILFEIDSSKNTVWKYVNPVNQQGAMTQGATAMNNSVFHCEFYLPTYSGFSGHTLAAGNEIEINPISPSLCELSLVEIISDENVFSLLQNPCLQCSVRINEKENIMLMDVTGRIIPLAISVREGAIDFDLNDIAPGFYFVRNTTSGKTIKLVRP